MANDTEINMTCRECGGTWGEPQRLNVFVAVRDQCIHSGLCRNSCHDKDSWAELEEDSDRIAEILCQNDSTRADNESLRIRIAELEEQNAALATDVAAYRHLHSEAGI